MPQDYYAPPGASAPSDDFGARLDQPVELVGRALNLYFAHWQAYGALGLLLLGPVAAAAHWYALGHPTRQGEFDWGELRINLVGTALVSPLAVASVIALLVARRDGLTMPSLGMALQGAAGQWGPLFAVRFVSGLKILAGLVLLVVPGVYFALRLAVCDEMVVLGGERASGSAMARSERWTKGRLGQVFSALFVAGLATNVPGTALGVVGSALEMQPLVWLGMAMDCALSPILTIVGALMYWDLERTAEGDAPG